MNRLHAGALILRVWGRCCATTNKGLDLEIQDAGAGLSNRTATIYCLGAPVVAGSGICTAGRTDGLTLDQRLESEHGFAMQDWMAGRKRAIIATARAPILAN